MDNVGLLDGVGLLDVLDEKYIVFSAIFLFFHHNHRYLNYLYKANPAMPATFSLEFPTKPFLHRYLVSINGGSLVFSLKSSFGMMIASAAEKELYPDLNWNRIHQAFNKYTDTAILHLPKDWLANYRYGFSLQPKQVVFINNMLQKRFAEELEVYCCYARKFGLMNKDAYYEFAERHGIEIDEHITFDNLKKMEQRQREQMQRMPKVVQRSLQFR